MPGYKQQSENWALIKIEAWNALVPDRRGI
jgi:hypothetical protein